MAERMEDIWLRQARDGDQDAFGCLVRAYEKRVFALTRRLCADPSDAEEAAQDAFLAVWQGLPNFRGEASFSTWLYRLTVNACTDILRRRQRRSGLDEPLDQAGARPPGGGGAEGASLRHRGRAPAAAGGLPDGPDPPGDPAALLRGDRRRHGGGAGHREVPDQPGPGTAAKISDGTWEPFRFPCV